jgi:tRNA modification GTPase
MSTYFKDTIAAIASAPGRGAIGVVRVSGPRAVAVAEAITHRAVGALKVRQAHYGAFFDADGSVIDQGIALRFEGPASYTGEDALELQAHGGPYVLKRLLGAVLKIEGVRSAAPGEFSQRAFLNDKLDLAQAESISDLIDAQSESAARSAARSLRGEFSEAVQSLAERIVHLRMLVEATLDFPEEELDFLKQAKALEQLESIRVQLAQVHARAQSGAALRTGLQVVIAGRPNVGKSSLLNALAEEELAIVTPIAGTTRDKLTQQITLCGVPLWITDTAGLRATEDEVERIGIARTREAISRADLVLRLLDVSRPDVAADMELDAELQGLLAPRVKTLRVWNKADLAPGFTPPEGELLLSAKRSESLQPLKAQLLDAAGFSGNSEDVFLARARHLEALAQTQSHIARAVQQAALGDQELELFAEELRLAHQSLQSITGRFSADDLLGEIFGKFCIGK